ncbi:MAG: hypothetical protein HZB43_11045 [candidate division Zixibacteria bacterium]|nr:hypothetical protein [candidate division Zixibacteria bacterium]
MRRLIVISAVATLLASSASAQDTGTGWKRASPPTQPPLRLFHSTQAISLPTAETPGKNVLQFEISHRFYPRFSDGFDYLYGLDGPALMRLGLGYAPTDRLVITLARSNFGGNVDLQGKYELLRLRSTPLPFKIAVQAGGAWNTQKRSDRTRGDSRNFQYYVQGIVNTMIGKSIALGVVPSYLHNSSVNTEKKENLFAVGLHGQVYLNHVLSVIAEWTPQVSGTEVMRHRPASFGLELETGGHFFKLVATNSVYLNPSQYLAGTENVFGARELRFGFLITRLLRT